MSINQHPAAGRLPRIATPDSHRTAGPGPVRRSAVRKLILDVRMRGAAIGPVGILVLGSGLALAALCTISAIQAGATYAIAAAAGYCTAACGACVCAALMQISRAVPSAPAAAESPQPNYAAWALVQTLRVSDASRLWCDIEPGCAASQESLAWAQAMLAAIKSGELPIRQRAGDGADTRDRERSNPSWATEIERAALKSWAASHGHLPQFLRG